MENSEAVANCVIEYLQKLIVHLYCKNNNINMNGKYLGEHDASMPDIEFHVAHYSKIKNRHGNSMHWHGEKTYTIDFQFSSEVPVFRIDGECELQGNDFTIFAYFRGGINSPKCDTTIRRSKHNLSDPNSIRCIIKSFRSIFKLPSQADKQYG